MAKLRYRFHSLEFGDTDIHLRTLRDNQQYDDPEGLAQKMGISSSSWPMFGVLYAAGEVLARTMQDYDITGLRILEVGCGIGLSSLVLNERLADITASDYHPEAEVFLQYNARLNNSRPIPFFRSAWGESCAGIAKFDLIIGSDLLYQPDHAGMLSGFINQHAKAACSVIIVDPQRGNGPSFCRHMNGFEFAHTRIRHEGNNAMTQPFNGHVLSFSRS
jgi:predicted nicotinamide N-methyase